MRGPFTETMVYADTNALKTWWKKIQLQYFGLISANNTFLACQYFTVRGVRTLNGKLVQHKLSNYYQKHPHPETAAIPAKISYYHFLDESFHFSAAINGIFWYEPVLYSQSYRVLRSPIFSMSDQDAKEMMRCCFTQESEGLQRSFLTHQEAMASYKVYVEKLDYLWQRNREMSLMGANSISRYLATQQKAFQSFEQHQSEDIHQFVANA